MVESVRTLALLLREICEVRRLFERCALCFQDLRVPERIEHTVRELIVQRVLAISLGYEDFNDHEELRRDRMLAMLVDNVDPTGASRVRARDPGRALAGNSTLNRLELTPLEATREDRYQKILCDGDAVDRLLVGLFLETHEQTPEEIVLDLDATDNPLHGEQEGRFSHGYCRC